MLKDRLVELRKRKNITQKELAKKLHITRDTYAQYEIGRRNPSYETLQKIADFFEVSTDYLLGRTDDPRQISSDENERNIRELLEEGELHWDGVPLTDEELITIRDLLKIVVKERIPKYLEEKNANKKSSTNEE